MNETPPPNNQMKPESANSRRKTLKIISIVVAAVILIAGIVYSVYAWQQGQQAQSTTSDNNTQTAPKEEEVTPTPTPTPSTDPYEGWLSATVKYEKITLKYPSTWTITNTGIPHSESDAVTPGYDKAKLVSPTGLTVTIDTGVSGIGGGPYGNRVISTAPITTLGENYYLGFGTYDGESDLVLKGTVGTASDTTAAWPPSKNISSLNGETFNVISVTYFDGAGNAIDKNVSDFQNDASYSDALMIIKSLTY